VDGAAVKAMDPLFETRVVSVAVLNMECVLHPYSFAQVDGILGEAVITRKIAVSRIAIADK